MKTALKYIGILVLVLVFLIIGAILALPHLLSTDLVKSRVAELVEQKTGRKLSINGETSFKLFPNIAVSLDDLTLSNPPGMTGAPLVKLASLHANLKLMPLLSGKTKVDSITLIEPRINLLVDEKGNRNWDFKTAQNNTDRTKTTAGENDFSLGKVTIKDGFVRYANAKDKIDEKIEAVNLALLQKPSDRSITAKSHLRWRQEILNLTAMIGEPDKLFAGKPSTVLINIASRLTKTEYVGMVTPGDQPSIDGFLTSDTPSLRKLAIFLGHDLPPGEGFGTFKLKTKIKASAKTVEFATGQLTFDNMNLVAHGDVQLKKPRPYINVDIEADRLDLNPYLGSQDSPSGGESTTTTDTPVDLSGLRAVDGRFSLKTKQILYKKARLDEGRFTIVMDKGRANATIESLKLYRGSATGKIVLDGSGSTGFIGGNLSMKDVLTGAILRDFAGFDKLAGKGTILGDFTTRGNSVSAFKQAASGTLKLTLLEGRIEGFDLARYVSDLTGTKIPGSGQSTNEKPMTAYDELSGLVNINKGIARNNDFLLTGKFFRVRAAGTADIVEQTLRFRIAPKLFSGSWNFAPPLRVSGSWSKPKVTLDTLAFLGGGGGVVRSFGGLLRGEKLELEDVLKNRGLQTDSEIETYLAGKKVNTRNDKPRNDKSRNNNTLNGAANPDSPLGGLLNGENRGSSDLLNDLFR